MSALAATEELAQKAETIYRDTIHGKVDGKRDGQIVMIDVDSGDYEIDEHLLPAADRLRVRRPAARLYPIRIGGSAIYSIRPRGARARK